MILPFLFPSIPPHFEKLRNHTICLRTFFTLICIFSSLYSTITGSDNLNDGFLSSSSVHSTKYHFSASITVPNTLSISYSSSISLALRLRQIRDDPICNCSLCKALFKVISFNFDYYRKIEISLSIITLDEFFWDYFEVFHV
uniref:Uncharacterized protein n=1 Tax=Rhizophagus irregularis (strain DAOM 181602 / DAOM 197198 / MUCL 43194) TaxID=747089 RepID=U9TTX9_RHIID